MLKLCEHSIKWKGMRVSMGEKSCEFHQLSWSEVQYELHERVSQIQSNLYIFKGVKDHAGFL